MTVLTGVRIVTPSGVVDDGWVGVDRGRITGVGSGSPGSGTAASPAGPGVGDIRDLGGGWLVPGFVDVHLHGGGGADVTRSPEAMADAVAFHRDHGTTSCLVSLMAQPVDALCEQLEWAAGLTAAGVIRGVHVEGPFLSEAQCGAQRPENLLLPDLLVLRKLQEAAQGCIRTMTVAPELPGADEVIAELTRSGVHAAVGHTAAGYDRTVAAFDAGAVLATHLFNAMGPSDHRAPGAAIAALDRGVYVELINDGQHVHDALVRLVCRTAPDATIFVTDAVSAAGVADGDYTLGDQTVVVRAGRARLAWTDRLAGSTLTMDVAFRRAVQVLGLGVPEAVALTSGNAARLLGLQDEVGAIRPGLLAHLVHLDADFSVVEVFA